MVVGITPILPQSTSQAWVNKTAGAKTEITTIIAMETTKKPLQRPIMLPFPKPI
jgi:hypothetical protein